VLITGTSKAKLNKTLVEAEEGRVLRYECDIRDNQAVESVVRKMADEGHVVDILINNVRVPTAELMVGWLCSQCVLPSVGAERPGSRRCTGR
jgi:short-subunit dehydrogenase